MNLGTPLISIIIPCYNQGQYLQEAVDSVLNSTYKNFEIIIVNDGSTKFLDILNDFSAPNTKIIHQENHGPSIARNNGIKSAKGKYILPLDVDDKIHSTYIEKAVKILETNPQIGIIYCDAEFFGTKNEKLEIQKYKFPNILWGNNIFCSAIFKKSDWEMVGGYKKEMYLGFESWEFWLSLIEKGIQVYKIPEILFSYRQSEKSRSTNLYKKNNPIKMIKQIIKFHPDLYADNIEKILIPLYDTFEDYSSKETFIVKIKYKINKILIKIIRKINNF
jgi:glycosyltransferase involved in cell wall biosynthesis